MGVVLYVVLDVLFRVVVGYPLWVMLILGFPSF